MQPSNLIIQSAAQEEDERQKRIIKAQSRYDGNYPQPLARTELDPSAKDNTIVNFSRRTVDVSAFYLFGKGVKFGVTMAGAEARAGTKTSPEEDWLEQCWTANEKIPLLMEMAISAGISGDGYVRLLEPETKGGFPEVVSIDPQYVTAIYDQQNFRKVLQWRVQWTGIDSINYAQPTPITYRVLVTRQDGGQWLVEDQESVSESPTFTTVDSAIWPYSFCPIFHTKNTPAPNQFHGRSDLEDDVLHLNDQVNFILSNINRILRAHGHPLQYVTGQAPKDVSRSIGDMLYLPNSLAKVGSVEMISDLTSSSDQLKELMDAYHEITGIPEVTAGKMDNVGQLSGLALQILYGPLLALTEVKRTYYGTMLSAVCMGLLEMHGSKAMSIDIQWPEILPSDPAAEANAAVAKQAAGVSKDTTISELGYDAKVEAEKRADEAKQAMAAQAAAFNAGPGQQDDEEEDEDDEK